MQSWHQKYHGGFNTGHNLAKATNFAVHPWPEGWRVVLSNQEVERPLYQCILPIERILGKEACDVVSLLFTTHTSQSTRYVCSFANAVFISLNSIIFKEGEGFSISCRATKVLFKFLENNTMPISLLFVLVFVCLECKQQPYFCPALVALQTYYHSTLHEPCLQCKDNLERSLSF